MFFALLVAVRAVHVYEQKQIAEFTEAAGDQAEGMSLRRALFGYAWTAALVVAAGVVMPFIGEQLAEAMGWQDSFVGTLLVAAATSMPELAVTVGAVRIGALDMAIGNLLGSNLFDILIIGIDDVFYRPGSLLARVSPVHAVSAMSALAMTGLAIVGLLYRPRTRLLGTVGWVSLGLFAIYLLNSMALYLNHG